MELCSESGFYSFSGLGLELKWEGVFFKGLITDAGLVPRGIPLFWEALPFREASRRRLQKSKRAIIVLKLGWW